MPRAHYAAETFIKNHPDGLLKPIVVRIQLEFGHFTKVSVAATAECQHALAVAREAMRKAKYS